jgi:hypothetical protein
LFGAVGSGFGYFGGEFYIDAFLVALELELVERVVK